MRTIPWAEPQIAGKEIEYVVEALQSTWISGGQFVERLENNLAVDFGMEHAISCSNGTAAIQMTYLALDLHPGDEVIIPGFGYLAAANVAVAMGLIPKFVDVDPNTWCIDTKLVEAQINEKTAALVALHTYGGMCSMSELLAATGHRGVPVIEDAAEAFGTTLDGHAAGSMGLVGTFSFQATKTITCGEGGLAVTNNPEIAHKMRLHRNHGVGSIKYLHLLPGNNFRLTNVQAAIACAQLERLPDIRIQRERVRDRYMKNLGNSTALTLQRDHVGVRQLPWAVAVRLKPSHYPRGRDQVMEDLQILGVETRPGFQSPSNHSYFPTPMDLPVSEFLSEEILVLPTYPQLTDNSIDRICENLISLSFGDT